MEAMTIWGVEGIVVSIQIVVFGVIFGFATWQNNEQKIQDWSLQNRNKTLHGAFHTAVLVRLSCEDKNVSNIQGGSVQGGQLGAEDQPALCQVEHDPYFCILQDLEIQFQVLPETTQNQTTTVAHCFV